LSPKLKSHAAEFHERKVKLKEEFKIRSEEQNLPVTSYHGDFGRKRRTSLKALGTPFTGQIVPIR
jgi:hypothetical protein